MSGAQPPPAAGFPLENATQHLHRFCAEVRSRSLAHFVFAPTDVNLLLCCGRWRARGVRKSHGGKKRKQGNNDTKKLVG